MDHCDMTNTLQLVNNKLLYCSVLIQSFITEFTASIFLQFHTILYYSILNSTAAIFSY